MAKADDFISPANLWGKPLPGSISKSAATETTKKKATGMRAEDEDYEDDEENTQEVDDAEEDVDVELEDATPVAELDEVDDEEAYVEAEVAEEEEEEDDETEYAPEEGDEDDVEIEAENEEEVDATVDADEEEVSEEATAPVNSGTTKKKVRDMATKLSGADHIRNEISRRQETGASLRGVDIVAALAKKNITVSPAQVSQLLKKSGAPAKKPAAAKPDGKSFVAARVGRKTAEVEQPRKASRMPAPAAPARSTSLPMTQIKAAGAFLEACDGCYETARDILSAHKQLATEFGG
jgi:hypothetical protein